MWFKLASATFTNHLGKMSDLSNTVKVNISASGFTISGATLTFSKNDPSGTSKTYTLTLQTGWEITSTPSIKTYSGPISLPTITGGTNGVYTLTVALNAQPTQGITIEITGASYVGTGTPDAPEPEEPDIPVNPPSGGTTGDAILNLADYATYIGCITGSTNTMQGGSKGSTDKGNMFYKIPLADFTNPTSVTVVAGASTKAYVAFFNTTTTANGETPPYAGGATAQTILDAGTSQTLTIPSDAVCMYVLATNGTGSSLRPASVTFHNATYKGSSDPASGSSSGGGGSSGDGTTEGGTLTTEKVFDVFWRLGYTIGSTGSVTSQPTYALSEEITVPSGKKLKYTPYSGEQIWMVIGLWNGDTWIERQTFDPAQVTSATTIDLGTATKIRIGYGRTSSSNINMDLTSLKHLQLEWV